MLFLVFCYLFLPPGDGAGSPCDSRISLVSASKEKQAASIEISVKASGNYNCTLSIENGSGLQKVSEKKGNGVSKVRFTGLNPEPVYLIEVEFLDEQGASRCRKLQLSQIVIE